MFLRYLQRQESRIESCFINVEAGFVTINTGPSKKTRAGVSSIEASTVLAAVLRTRRGTSRNIVVFYFEITFVTLTNIRCHACSVWTRTFANWLASCFVLQKEALVTSTNVCFGASAIDTRRMAKCIDALTILVQFVSLVAGANIWSLTSTILTVYIAKSLTNVFTLYFRVMIRIVACTIIR